MQATQDQPCPQRHPSVTGLPRLQLGLIAALVLLGHWWAAATLARLGPWQLPKASPAPALQGRWQVLDASEQPTAPAPLQQVTPMAPAAPVRQALPLGRASLGAPAGRVVSQAAASTLQTDAPSGQPEPAADWASLPPSTRLLYQVRSRTRGLEREAVAALEWSTDGRDYTLSATVQIGPTTAQTERSSGQVLAQGLSPKRYARATARRSEQATHFLPEQGVVRFSANRPDQALPPAAQDPLSAWVQVAALFAANPAAWLRRGSISMPVAGLTDVQIWHWVVEGHEQWAGPNGPLETVKLTRQPRHEYDHTLELWLAPQRAHLPVQLRWRSQAWRGSDESVWTLTDAPSSPEPARKPGS